MKKAESKALPEASASWPPYENRHNVFPASGPFIRERFASCSCLLTASSGSPIFGRDFSSNFLALMQQLQDLDQSKEKFVIWSLSRVFQELKSNVLSINQGLAARNFEEFRKTVAETRDALSGDWFSERSAFAVAHPGKDLVEKKADEYGFEPAMFGSASYHASKFFRSMPGKPRRSIWSKLINPPRQVKGEQRTRKHVVTAFIAENEADDRSRAEVEYFSHGLDSEGKPTAVKRYFSSNARDRTVNNIYRATQLLSSNEKPSVLDGPVIDLFKAGFLLLNLEELVGR